MAYQPPVHLSNSYSSFNKHLNSKKRDEDLLDLGYSNQPDQTVVKKNDSAVSHRKKGHF